MVECHFSPFREKLVVCIMLGLNSSVHGYFYLIRAAVLVPIGGLLRPLTRRVPV